MALTKVATIRTQTRNMIINGNMKIAQRGTSATPTGGFQYLLDRHVGWITNPGSVTGETMTQSSLSAGFPGVAPQAEGRTFRMYGTLTALDASFNRMQRVESIRLRDGNRLIDTVSMGVWVYQNNFQNATIQLLQATGGSGDDDWSSSTVIAQDIVTIPDNTWTFVKLENVSLPTGKGIEFRISLSNPAATVFADTYTTEMMMNEGSVVEAFTTMGRDQEEEEKHCFRYYWQGVYRVHGQSNSSAQYRSSVQHWPVPMRANPSTSTQDESLTAGNLTFRASNGVTGAVAVATLGGAADRYGGYVTSNVLFSASVGYNLSGTIFVDAEL